MIDCPICHVKNNDDARFCAECGQRLTAQGSAPSLSEPTPAQGVGSWGQQPPVQAAPPPAAPPPAGPSQAHGHEPPTGGRPKLKSPLLSGGDDEDYGGGRPGQGGPGPGGAGQYGGGQGADDAGANRLRQMSQNQRPDVQPAVDPNRQFKNPYDPRNANPQENQPQGAPPEGGSRKLRSPLLSGEEFDDSDFAEQDPPPANVRGGGLRSPLLGGGEGGGGGGHLRSPMLGGGRQGDYDDMDEEPHGGGGHLRSPLLGGGGGYTGNERRRAADQNYGGTERRQGGLRSPILGGAGGGDYYDEYDEDEPIDEDDPTVLRSPLLAARRPHNERPPKQQMPATSNTANPPPAGQMPEYGRNLPNPSNSYTSLRSVRNAAPQTVGPAPSSVPPVPTEPVSNQYHPNPQGYPQQPMPAQGPGPMPSGLPMPGPMQAGNPGYPQQQAYSGQPQQQMPSQPGAAQQAAQQAPQQMPPQGPSGPPTNVPPSFSSVYTERRPSPEPTAPVPTAQPVRADEVAKFNKAAERGTESGITVQPPVSGSQPIIPGGPAKDETPRNLNRRRSTMLGGGDEDDAQDNYAPSRSYQPPAAPPSPLPKIIGGVAMLMFLVKSFSFFTGFMASDWKQYSWLMLDQVTLIVVFLCVAVLGLTRRD